MFVLQYPEGGWELCDKPKDLAKALINRLQPWPGTIIKRGWVANWADQLNEQEPTKLFGHTIVKQSEVQDVHIEDPS